jgi:HPt (histidine-containing phosphotransfer) domain-containing protein
MLQASWYRPVAERPGAAVAQMHESPDLPILVPVSQQATGPAIDMAHLARITLGDLELANEVLQLFARQADLLLGRMRDAEPRGVATLAHTLCGSARGVGAWRVAAAAELLEQEANRDGQIASALARLRDTVGEARRAIPP